MYNPVSSEFIRNLICYWHLDTIHLSEHRLDNPAIQILQRINNWRKDKNGNDNTVIKLMLEYIKDNPCWIFMYIPYFTNDCPEIPKSKRGKFNELKEIYLNWGKEKGYIK